MRDAALAEGRTLLNEHEAKALLAAFGLPVPASVLARTREEAIEAARTIGFPVVVKILSPDITHKSDVGGVRLSLQNAEMVATRLRRHDAACARAAARRRASTARWCSRCCATSTRARCWSASPPIRCSGR